MKNLDKKYAEYSEWCQEHNEEIVKRRKLIDLFEKKILYHLDSSDLIKVILYVSKAVNDGDLKLNSLEEYEEIMKRIKDN